MKLKIDMKLSRVIGETALVFVDIYGVTLTIGCLGYAGVLS